MIRKIILSFGAILFLSAAYAETILFNEQNSFVSPRITFADGVFTISGNGRFMSRRVIRLDENKRYTLQMQIRCTPGSPEVMAYVGFQQFDAQSKFLLPEYYRVVRQTSCTLLEPAAQGDTQIKITRPAAWNNNAVRYGWYIAFDTSGEVDDVPNMNVIRIRSFEEIPGGLLITLSSPLREPHRRGEKVCFHSAGPGMYTALQGRRLTDQWQEISGTVQGFSHLAGHNQWWQDAAVAKILLVLSPASADRNLSVEIKDVQIIVE
ncbi:MAG: hypothetical protein E7053_01300 [Lentisphaerae bacterium]|nr:hypothetical protein [Lentisphaerota bacterium]